MMLLLIRVSKFVENWPICLCGCEINLAETNYAGPELPLWEGATLCNDCYAAERVSERDRS